MLFKNGALILNLICVLLALLLLFFYHIPVTENSGEYWSLNDMVMLDVETNKLSLEALEIAKNKGDIEEIEVIFKDRVAHFNSTMLLNNKWDNLNSSLAAKLFLCILSIQFILLVRGKVKYNNTP